MCFVVLPSGIHVKRVPSPQLLRLLAPANRSSARPLAHLHPGNGPHLHCVRPAPPFRHPLRVTCAFCLSPYLRDWGPRVYLTLRMCAGA